MTLTGGISLLPEKLDAIKSMPSVQNVKEFRLFLGLTSYYSNHINHYSDITYTLAKPWRKMYLTYEQNTSKDFHRAEKMLQNPLIFTFQNPSKPYFLFTNASRYWCGATLCQYTSESDKLDHFKLIIFISRKFSDANCNYVALVREYLQFMYQLK